MVIALDFDGTLCEHKFPEIGKPRLWLIEMAKKWRNQGHKLILWTCREDVLIENEFWPIRNYLTEAVEFCAKYGLEFDALNRNLGEDKHPPQCFSRKIIADIYIDDKASYFNDATHTLSFSSRLCQHGNYL